MSTLAAASAGSRTRLEPARLGVWLFLVSEAMFFTGLLAAFVVLRTGSSSFGGPGGATSTALGGAATALLATSSVCLFRATSGPARPRGDRVGHRGAATWVLVAWLMGVAFLALQALEWRHLIASGVSTRTNLYWSSFFVLTGAHGLHVAGGVAWMAVAWKRVRATSPAIPAEHEASRRGLELCATYWHFVDAVWLVLFVLLYLSS